MTAKQALSRAREMLLNQNIEDSALEAELLLRHILRKNRTELFSEPDRKLSSTEAEVVTTLEMRGRKS